MEWKWEEELREDKLAETRNMTETGTLHRLIELRQDLINVTFTIHIKKNENGTN